MQYYKLKIFLVLVPLLTICCNSHQNVLTKNQYFTHIDDETKYTQQLILFNNGKFKYTFEGSLIYGKSEGSWLQNGKKIFLSSDEKYKTGIINSTEKRTNARSGVFIKDVQGNPLGYAFITFDSINNKGITVDQNGYANLDKITIGRKIQIYYIGDVYTYHIKNPESNYFEFEIRLKDYSLMFFENNEWNLKKNKILSPDGELFKLQ
jgi:hypothetical protein